MTSKPPYPLTCGGKVKQTMLPFFSSFNFIENDCMVKYVSVDNIIIFLHFFNLYLNKTKLLNFNLTTNTLIQVQD